ncbi:uroporphyrinogen-III C-methyltransferase [Mariprofundus micogutta]|nr:uroporphyrinogen-III C-methyltransferase [Mariprofundus micogutta]
MNALYLDPSMPKRSPDMVGQLSAPLQAGEVALVGAGPGDPDLLTIAAIKLLADCDAIVHDALVSEAILSLGSINAECIYAGKRGGRPSADQQDISDALIRLAKENKRVVRLKGGDPFVFGRGGEEARALVRAGVKFRVVPGITSGVAGPAMAGIPVTDRTVNSSIAFLTGHELSDESRINWPALVSAFPVLVFYMAARILPDLAERLIVAGLSESMPVAIIHNASLPDETVEVGTLAGAKSGSIKALPPSIVIVGEVVDDRTPWKGS